MTEQELLKKIFDKQRRFMGVLGIDTDIPFDVSDPRLIQAILGLASEAGEVAQAINVKYRHWANGETEFVFNDLGEEAIDVLFYLIELYVLMGFTDDDVYDMYCKKLSKNLTRIIYKNQADGAPTENTAEAINFIIELDNELSHGVE